MREDQLDQKRRWAVACRRMMERECRRIGLERDGKEPRDRGVYDQILILRLYEKALRDYPTLGMWHDPSKQDAIEPHPWTGEEGG